MKCRGFHQSLNTMRHQSLKADFIVLIIVFAVIVTSRLAPDVMAASRYYILGAVMLFIGIPHGAIDHIISSRIYKLDYSLSEQLKFYLPYLLLIALMALIWMISGIAGFIVFAVITIYHFGQADMEHLHIPAGSRYMLIVSRGIMLLSLIVFFDVTYTFPIIETATGLVISKGAWIFKHGYELGLILALQHPLIMLMTMSFHRKDLDQPWWYPVFDSLLIVALFALSDPIIGFSIYFAFWHSLGHVFEMKEFFNELGESFSFGKFYRLAFPFTLISIAGLGIIYLLDQAYGKEEQMVALLFILISVLTLPHVLVAQKMLEAKN